MKEDGARVDKLLQVLPAQLLAAGGVGLRADDPINGELELLPEVLAELEGGPYQSRFPVRVLGQRNCGQGQRRLGERRLS